MLKSNHLNTISNDKLSTFFANHFESRQNELQPEVINPEKFTHIQNNAVVNIDTSPPTEK